MAVMLSNRNLRNAPSLDPAAVITPAVIAPAGKKVEIIEKADPSFLHIKFTDGNQERDGWVTALVVNQESDEVGGPLDKLVFAEACVRRAVSWGTSAHYLMAIAEMRTHVTDGPNANGVDVGPFALSPFEWAFYTTLTDYDLGIAAGDIVNWRSQCSVFAVMTLTIQQNLATLISSQPTFSQLYFAQMIGAKATASAIANPAQKASDLISAVAPADFKSDGIEAGRILDRFPSLLKDATAAVALQGIDAALQQALDATNPFILKVAGGETIDTAPSSSGPPTAPLGDASYAAAAAALGPGVQVAMIRAFAEVESGGKSGFGPAGLPIIAFEGHIFRKYTKGAFDKSNPLLSYPYRKKAGPEWQTNNKNQETAWKTLNAALALNHDAALLACSWGMFQVMGFNYKMCGYSGVDAFVDNMKAGQQGQLDAFIGFCKATRGLTQALAAKNFATCATLYNGADFGDYDKRIEKAFKKYGGT
jgi:N-acetylmuramidase